MNIEDKTQFIEELWASEKDRLWRHAYLLLYDRELANEAVMDTFETALRKIDILISHPLPPAWLMVTMNYKVQNIRTRESYQKKLYSEATKSLDRSLIEIMPASTKPEDAKLLQLYYGDQHSLEDISSMMNTSKGKLAGRLFRIRKQLKKFFTGDKPKPGHGK